MNNLLITYTYNTILPYAMSINKHLRTVTLNMHMKPFHTAQTLHGLLDTHLGIKASESLVEAILTYPDALESEKNVTVIFDVDGFGS